MINLNSLNPSCLDWAERFYKNVDPPLGETGFDFDSSVDAGAVTERDRLAKRMDELRRRVKSYKSAGVCSIFSFPPMLLPKTWDQICLPFPMHNSDLVLPRHENWKKTLTSADTVKILMSGATHASHPYCDFIKNYPNYEPFDYWIIDGRYFNLVYAVFYNPVFQAWCELFAHAVPNGAHFTAGMWDTFPLSAPWGIGAGQLADVFLASFACLKKNVVNLGPGGTGSHNQGVYPEFIH